MAGMTAWIRPSLVRSLRAWPSLSWPLSPADAFEAHPTSRTIPDSTRNHARLSTVLVPALLLVPALIAIAAASNTEPSNVTFVVAAALILVAMLAMRAGMIGGAFVGIVFGAAILYVIRSSGRWDSGVYPAAGVVVTGSVVVGLVAGRIGSMLRDAHGRAPVWADALPVLGSLGLLHPAIGEARLDEEIERARYADSPLSILRINAALTRDLAGPDRDRALRAVSRTFESLLHVIHVPFAYSDVDLVAILPEMSADDASELGERVRLAASEATVIVGRDRVRRRYGELGTVRSGVATFRIDGHSGGTLLAAAVPRTGTYLGDGMNAGLGRVGDVMARHRLIPHALGARSHRPTRSSSFPILQSDGDGLPTTIGRSEQTTAVGH
jgi:uncharacterized integral membrane protein/GGDEF domain-containing protein